MTTALAEMVAELRRQQDPVDYPPEVAVNEASCT